MAEQSGTASKSSEKLPLNERIADLVLKVVMTGGVAGGGLGAFWSLFQESDLPKAIASAVIGLGISYAAKMLQPVHKGNERRLEQAGQAIDDKIERLSEGAIAKITNVEDRYLACQAADCETCRTEGMVKLSGIFTPMLEQVYVSLDLAPTDLLPGLGPPPDAIDLEQPEATWRRNIDIWALLARAKQDPIYSQMAILAWGGYGKTTLLRHLTYTLGKKQQPEDVVAFVPVLLLLRKHRDVLSQEEPPSLPDLITQVHIPGLPASEGLQMPQDWARHQLRTGRMLVMLDGFDEVPQAQRPRIARWLNAQMRAYRKSVFILTSRPKAYQDQEAERLNLNTKLFVQKLTPDKRQTFVRQWYWCQEYYSHGKEDIPAVRQEAKAAAESLLGQIEERPELSDLTENPLLLNMVAMFHRYDPSAKLPKRQVELYQQICKLLLKDRPGARQLELMLDDWEVAQTTLQMLALEMMQSDEKRVEKRVLLRRLARYLQEQEETVAVSPFLKQIEEVSELLVQREPDEYEFPHLSFQEFLAAKEVVRLGQEALLYEHFRDDKWKPMILLYAAQTKKPSSLIRAALERDATTLAYRCLQETRKRIDDDLKAELIEVQDLREAAAATQTSRYQQLETYLSNGQWKEADEETYRLMITTVGKDEGQWFDPEELLTFPCDELKAIDGLWLKHSDGHFGFSVQKEIYQACDGILDGLYHEKEWNRFCHKVGWQKEEEYVPINFSKSTPRGHLPLVGFGVGASLLSHTDL